jgi:hypothetical protein
VKAAKRKAIEDNIAKAKASREQTDADHRRAGQSGVRNTINYEEARGCGRGRGEQGKVEGGKERWRRRNSQRTMAHGGGEERGANSEEQRVVCVLW